MALATIVVPEVLGDLVLEKLADKVIALPGVDTTTEFPIGQNGTIWEVPYQKPVSAMIHDGEGITLVPSDVEQTTYRMPVVRRGQAYKIPSIDKLAAHKDPAGFLSEQIAQVIAEAMQKTRFYVLEGAIPSANRFDADDGICTGDDVSAAKILVGDKYDSMKYLVLHSKVYNDLE